jgi:ribosomal protein L29
METCHDRCGRVRRQIARIDGVKDKTKSRAYLLAGLN